MTCEERQKLIDVITSKCGLRMMLAVDAALRVASNHWTETETVRFGTIVRDMIKEKGK